MKVKKLLCIVLSLTAVCSLLLIRDSVAWFDTSSGSPASGTIRVDKMAFSFEGLLGSYLQYTSGTHSGQKYVVTDQNLIVTNGGRITVKNESTIQAEVRFKITYATPSDANRVYKAVTTGNDPDSLKVDIASGWTQGTTGGAPDGYFYRTFLVDDTGDTPVPVDEEPVAAINEILYLDELFVNGSDILSHNDYFSGSTPFSGAVHVIFEAKQADHVTWTQIADWA